MEMTDAQLEVQHGALEDAARHLSHAVEVVGPGMVERDFEALNLALSVLRRNRDEVGRALQFRRQSSEPDVVVGDCIPPRSSPLRPEVTTQDVIRKGIFRDDGPDEKP